MTNLALASPPDPPPQLARVLEVVFVADVAPDLAPPVLAARGAILIAAIFSSFRFDFVAFIFCFFAVFFGFVGFHFRIEPFLFSFEFGVTGFFFDAFASFFGFVFGLLAFFFGFFRRGFGVFTSYFRFFDDPAGTTRYR